ncbi:MAG: nuclear transport factor 2 family protein [Pseudomonadota bacterium]
MTTSRLLSTVLCGATILGLLLISPPVCAVHHGEDTAATLSAQLDAFLAGASVNDRATHEAFWADDLIYTSSSGERFGKDNILAGMAAEAEETPDASDGPATVYTASEVQVQDFGDTAVVTFRLHASEDGVPSAEYLNTGVFRHSDAGWKAVTWQATRAAERDRASSPQPSKLLWKMTGEGGIALGK